MTAAARRTIPIYVASLQEKAIREVGRIADGWVPTFWPYRHLKDGIALLAEGAARRGPRSVGRSRSRRSWPIVPLDDAMARAP